MGQHQVAAGRERVAQGGDDPPGILGLGDEVQDGDQQQADRLAEVDQVLTGNGLVTSPPPRGAATVRCRGTFRFRTAARQLAHVHGEQAAALPAGQARGVRASAHRGSRPVEADQDQ
ncbi:MAG TPA: hypothetical protein VK586_15540 [Streptosporangiaceae bacterium]|nr:hypothetical protein [Streptosporangiaceae bacterium]